MFQGAMETKQEIDFKSCWNDYHATEILFYPYISLHLTFQGKIGNRTRHSSQAVLE